VEKGKKLGPHWDKGLISEDITLALRGKVDGKNSVLGIVAGIFVYDEEAKGKMKKGRTSVKRKREENEKDVSCFRMSV